DSRHSGVPLATGLRRFLPLPQGFVRFRLVSPSTRLVLCTLAALTVRAAAYAQTPPRDTSARRADSIRARLPRPPADSDSKRNNLLGIPGTDSLPIQLNIRVEVKTERDRNLACNSLEAAQVTALSGCNASFLFPTIEAKPSLKSFGSIGDHWHV